MELIVLSEHVRLIPSPINIGVVLLGGGRAALIDSGLAPNHARKVLALLAEHGLEVTTVLNSHIHADHVGGNRQVKQITGARILAPALEAPGLAEPMLQPIGLYGGVPPAPLINRFTVFDPCPADEVLGSELTLGDRVIKVLDLPGHSLDQKGFLVDGVAFVADALFPPATLIKHRLLYTFDPDRQMATLAWLEKHVQARTWVGGHFPPTADPTLMLVENRLHHENVFALVQSLLVGMAPFDRVVKEVLKRLGVVANGWEHFLYRATVKGYLTGLHRRGQAGFRILDHLPVWYRTEA